MRDFFHPSVHKSLIMMLFMLLLGLVQNDAPARSATSYVCCDLTLIVASVAPDARLKSLESGFHHGGYLLDDEIAEVGQSAAVPHMTASYIRNVSESVYSVSRIADGLWVFSESSSDRVDLSVLKGCVSPQHFEPWDWSMPPSVECLRSVTCVYRKSTLEHTLLVPCTHHPQ